MSPISLADADTAAPRPARRRANRMGPGVVASIVLHVAVAALIFFGLPSLLSAPPEVPAAIPVDLVRFGTETAAPPAPEKAEVPQEKAPETADLTPPEPVPAPQTPPPPQSLAKVEEGAAPNVLSAPHADDATRTKPVEAPRPAPKPAAKPQREPSPPVDAFEAKLQSLARLHEPTPPVPPSPARQDGTGVSNRTATSNTAATGPDALYSVKDFLRAQIERRWNLDRSIIGAGDPVISIHLLLNRDGKVASAEVVPDPRLATDENFRTLAMSARNAALLSSPLTLPPGTYDLVKDITLDFDPRKVSQ
jgi:outer membrane biosynthesis protein TonB